MKHKIVYHSENILPAEIDNQIEILHERVKDNRLELDKLFLNVESLRGYLIRWFAEHQA